MKMLDTKYKGRGIVWIYCWNEREREGTNWVQICIGEQYSILCDLLDTISRGK